MTSKHAPPTIPTVETGTPPREWSESVLTSSPARDTPATFLEIKGRKGNPETEGTPWGEFQVPKEFEKQHESQSSNEPKPTTTSDHPSMGVQTAKQYVPEQAGKAGDYTAHTAAAAALHLPNPHGVKDTVSSYLSSGKSREQPHLSLPSTELKGAQPSEHTGGVGALPGNLSESSVALLPDERQERAQEHRSTSPRQRRDTIKPSAESGDDEIQPRESEKENTKITRDPAFSKDEPVASQPSDAPPKSVEASAVGPVGSNTSANPGPEVESQREANETKSQQAPNEQAEATAPAATGMVGTTPSAEELGEKQEDIEGSNLTSEELGGGKGLSQDVQEEGNKEEGTTTAKKVGSGYREEYHPAELHPPPPGASAAEYQSSLSAQQEGQELPTTRTGKRASISAEKKPGFMTMVKGEMKILAGKMSGDEHKVEEGKKIVHGEA